MAKSIKIVVAADADQDNCLAAAAEAYIEEHPALAGWDLAPQWEGGEDGDREQIVLSVPEWAISE